MERTPEFNRMQLVKRRMFAMRNGVIADTLRRAGAPFSIIFGLNLPQITEIAAEFGPDPELADMLWANTSTRESMLLAPQLVDPANFTQDRAIGWIEAVNCTEVADILCLKLLRHLPYAMDLVDEYAGAPDTLQRYTALRLMCNIARQDPEKARALGHAALADGNVALRGVATRLTEY